MALECNNICHRQRNRLLLTSAKKKLLSLGQENRRGQERRAGLPNKTKQEMRKLRFTPHT